MGIPSNRSVSVRGARLKSPDLVWAIDFQFDSTTDGKAIKIASMIDEHTRLSLLNLVERSGRCENLEEHGVDIGAVDTSGH
jgi:putative transposase